MRENLRSQIGVAVRQVLDSKVEPIECFAIAYYARALRAARAGGFDNTYTQLAFERIRVFDDARLQQCLAELHGRDPSLEPYTPGEFGL